MRKKGRSISRMRVPFSLCVESALKVWRVHFVRSTKKERENSNVMDTRSSSQFSNLNWVREGVCRRVCGRGTDGGISMCITKMRPWNFMIYSIIPFSTLFTSLLRNQKVEIRHTFLASLLALCWGVRCLLSVDISWCLVLILVSKQLGSGREGVEYLRRSAVSTLFFDIL